MTVACFVFYKYAQKYMGFFITNLIFEILIIFATYIREAVGMTQTIFLQSEFRSAKLTPPFHRNYKLECTNHSQAMKKYTRTLQIDEEIPQFGNIAYM